MSEIFKLFDGGSVGTEGQHASSFSDVEPENDLVSRIASGTDSVELKVDYSDFENFVTFNSAESYVTVTADQILNEYPFGGTVDDLQKFLDSIDGYQRYFLERWPSRTGHLRLNPSISSSYVSIADFGVIEGVSRTSLLSPGSGSFSIQGWVDSPILTGSDDVIVVIDKRNTAGDGYSVYMTGSAVAFTITSGSSTHTLTADLSTRTSFFSAVCDRAGTGSIYLYTATTGTFPVLRAAESISDVGTRIDLGSGSFFIGSGSVSTKVVVPFTGSIDDLSWWTTTRHSAQLTSSFNRKVYAQPGLMACWRFNEATTDTPTPTAAIARDCSGHRLDGRIQTYFSGSRGSGSLAFDSPDPILTLDDPDVVDYVVAAQVSGALYDRDNQTLIWKMFPEAFTQQDPVSSDVFKNFSLILARSFDRVKLYIDQLVNMRRVNYGEFDQAPDEFLNEVGESLGWDLHGSFVDIDALKYFLSRDITAGPAGNAGLDTRLSEIKSQFWKRSLLNLMYIYKTKGTRESVEALLRTYGVDNSFIRLKEYARLSEARFPVERVVAEKSVWTLTFGSGSYDTTVTHSGSTPIDVGTSGDLTAELRVRFPGPTNDDMPPTKTSGSILTLSSGSNHLALWYQKPTTTSTTGNLFASSSDGILTLASASIFDDNFYNLAIVRESATGSLTISVKRYEDDVLVLSTSSITTSTGLPAAVTYPLFTVGAYAGSSSGEFWAQEARAWDAALTDDELDSHARDFNSYGRDVSHDNQYLSLHWRLNDGFSAEADGTVYPLPSWSSTQNLSPTGSGFIPSVIPYKKFLLDYAYIPSIEYGWNQKKIRSFSGSWIDPYEAYTDENIVSLEFNMYDALNEDISHVMTSYDELNFAVGIPVNKYRPEYERLQQMRETYFKRLQGELKLRTFIDMMDFFDVSFVRIVEKLLPARAVFKGDEMVIESHMLERPKYQYGIRPILEGTLIVSGTLSLIDRDEDWT